MRIFFCKLFSSAIAFFIVTTSYAADDNKDVFNCQDRLTPLPILVHGLATELIESSSTFYTQLPVELRNLALAALHQVSSVWTPKVQDAIRNMQAMRLYPSDIYVIFHPRIDQFLGAGRSAGYSRGFDQFENLVRSLDNPHRKVNPHPDPLISLVMRHQLSEMHRFVKAVDLSIDNPQLKGNELHFSYQTALPEVLKAASVIHDFKLASETQYQMVRLGLYEKAVAPASTEMASRNNLAIGKLALAKFLFISNDRNDLISAIHLIQHVGGTYNVRAKALLIDLATTLSSQKFFENRYIEEDNARDWQRFLIETALVALTSTGEMELNSSNNRFRVTRVFNEKVRSLNLNIIREHKSLIRPQYFEMALYAAGLKRTESDHSHFKFDQVPYPISLEEIEMQEILKVALQKPVAERLRLSAEGYELMLEHKFTQAFRKFLEAADRQGLLALTLRMVTRDDGFDTTKPILAIAMLR